MQDSTNSQVLFSLLDANQAFALQARGTTNHCPMALIAMAKMGAGDQRLADFFEFWRGTYAMDAEIFPLDLTLTRENYLQSVGRASQFLQLQDFFYRWIQSDNICHVVRELFNELPLAPASGAFHALIRLGYGVKVSHCGEVAAAMAAMVVGNFSTHLPSQGGEYVTSLQEGFSQLSKKFKGRRVEGEMITTKMHAVFKDQEFQQACPRFLHHEGILAEMRDLAILCYFQTQSFTALHMVTALEALASLSEKISDLLSNEVLEDVWTALCVAYVSIGAPPLLLMNPSPVAMHSSFVQQEAWLQLFALATQSNDDHVIKFTYSCFTENQRRPNFLYLDSVKLLHAQKN